MAITNKFILKSDISDFEQKLDIAKQQYVDYTDKVKLKTQELSKKLHELAEERTKLSQINLPSRPTTAVKNLQKEIVLLEQDATKTKELAVAKKQLSDLENNIKLSETYKQKIKLLNEEKRAITDAKNGYSNSASLQKDNIDSINQKLKTKISLLDQINTKQNNIKFYDLPNQNIVSTPQSINSSILTEKNNQALQERIRLEEEELSVAKDRLLVYSKEEQILNSYAKKQSELTGLLNDGKITTDEYRSATKNLTKAQKEETASLHDGTNAIVRKIRQYESLIVWFYAVKQGYDATLGRGHEFNKLIETETVGLKLLIAQNLENVDSKGQEVTALEKFTYAQNEATKAIKIAREINVQTPHTLGETLQIYKLLVPQVLKFGGNLEDVGTITKNVSISATAMGIEFDQLLKTVDSLMSGQMNESALRRAMEQFGITQKEVNKQIKEGGDVVKLFIDKLKQIDPAGQAVAESWVGVTSKFINAWDELWGELQKPLFDNMKDGISSFTKLIEDNNEEIVTTVEFIKEYADEVAALGAAYILSNKAVSVYNALQSTTLSRTSATRKATVLLSGALKAMPLMAVVAGLGFVIDKLMDASSAQKALAEATRLTAEEMEKLSIKGLEANKILLQKALLEKREEIASAAADARNDDVYGFLKDSKETQAAEDLRLETLKKEQRELREQLSTLRGIKSKKEESAKVEAYSTYQKEVKELENIDKKILEIGKSVTDLHEKGEVLPSGESIRQQAELNLLIEEQAKLKSKVDQGEKEFKGYTPPESTTIGVKEAGLTEDTYKKYLDELNSRKSETAKINDKIVESEKHIAIIRKRLESGLTKEEEAEERKKLNTLLQVQGHLYSDLEEAKKDDAKSSSESSSSQLSSTKDLISEKQNLLDIEREISLAKRTLDGKEVSESSRIEEEIQSLSEKYNIETDIVKKKELQRDIYQAQIDLQKALNDEAIEAVSLEEQRYQTSILIRENNGEIVTYNEQIAKEIELLEEKKSLSTDLQEIAQYDYEIQQAIADQKELQKESQLRYAELAGDDVFVENYELEKERTELQRHGVDLTIDEIKWLKQKRDLYADIKNIAYSTLDAIASQFAETGDLTKSIESGLEDGAAQIRDAMKASGNPYLMAAAYGTEIISGLMTEQPDAFQSMEVNIGADNTGIADSIDTLNDVMYPHLQHTEAMKKHLESMDNNFGAIAIGLSQSGTYDYTGMDVDTRIRYNIDSGIGSYVAGGANGLLSDVPVFGDILTGISNSLFGSSQTSVERAGLYFGEQTIDAFLNGVNVASYTDTKTSSKSLFGLVSSTSYDTNFDEVDIGLRSNFQRVMESGLESILTSTTSLGMGSLEAALSEYSIEESKFDFKDKSQDEIAEILSGYFGETLDGAVESLGTSIDQYTQIGEGQYESLLRVSTGYEQATEFLERLGISIVEFSDIADKRGDIALEAIRDSIVFYDRVSDGVSNIVDQFDGSADELVSLYTELDTFQRTLRIVQGVQAEVNQSMIDGAGNLDTLVRGQGSYINNFYTDEEQLGFIRSSLANEFDRLNISMPKSLEAFRDMAEDASPAVYGAMMSVADSFYTVHQQAIELAESREKNIISIYDSINDYQQSIDEANEDLYEAHLEYAQDVSDQINSLFSNTVSDIDSLLVDLSRSTLSDTELSSDYIRSFNQAQLQMEQMINSGQIDSDLFNSLYDQLSSDARAIGQNIDSYADGDRLIQNIQDVLNYNRDFLTDETFIQKVELVSDSSDEHKDQIEQLQNTANELKSSTNLLSYLNSIVATDKNVKSIDDTFALEFAKNHNLSAQQFAELQDIASDGYLTRTEMESLSEFSEAQKEELIRQTGLFATEETLEKNTYGINSATQPAGYVKGSDGLYYIDKDADGRPDYLTTLTGYSTGGYTGNIPESEIAGVTHGRGYVINAPTVRDLGINDGNGGVFKEMLTEIKSLKKEIKELKATASDSNRVLKINANEVRENRKLTEELVELQEAES